MYMVWSLGWKWKSCRKFEWLIVPWRIGCLFPVRPAYDLLCKHSWVGIIWCNSLAKWLPLCCLQMQTLFMSPIPAVVNAQHQKIPGSIFHFITLHSEKLPQGTCCYCPSSLSGHHEPYLARWINRGCNIHQLIPAELIYDLYHLLLKYPCSDCGISLAVSFGPQIPKCSCPRKLP